MTSWLPGLPAVELAPVPAEAMLGHLRPRGERSIRRIATEGPIEEFHVSGCSVGGAELFVSLRMLVTDRSDPRIVLSLPGGAGALRDPTLVWLASKFGGNHAAIDWIGRGRSPQHDTVKCTYDPIWLGGDDFRDAYAFHNLAAIWTAFDWLHEAGFAPKAVAGGSWGGVFALLLGALDGRVARVYASFGCGGFSVPGIEKRSMWDAAFGAMGRHRVREWCRAFDPLLRARDIAAQVYFETATNDKFFSLDMAMATWNALPNRRFLALAPNQDHTMRPFGAQPYIVEALTGTRDEAALAQAFMEGKRFSSLPDAGEEVCWPIDDLEFGAVRIALSHQLPERGNMSRAWQLVPARARSNSIAAFATGASGDGAARTLFYLTKQFRAGARILHAATALQQRGGEMHEADPPPLHELLPDPKIDVWTLPLGDKMAPSIAAAIDGFRVGFQGVRRARCVRFGIEPWRLPADWTKIELAADAAFDPAGLVLFLSVRYNRIDEASAVADFAEPRAERRGDGVHLRAVALRDRRGDRAAFRAVAAWRPARGAARLRRDRRGGPSRVLHRRSRAAAADDRLTIACGREGEWSLSDRFSWPAARARARAR